MAERFSEDDIEFEEMSEDEAVATFVKDGYDKYVKRSARYGSNLSPDSEWAKSPAKMFVAFYEDTPVGVMGFSEYKGVLLGAGIHIREGYRKEDGYGGLFSILVKKILSEKGSKTLYINVAKEGLGAAFRAKGFKDMEKDELPQDIQEDLQGTKYSDQVQKWMKLKAKDAAVNEPMPTNIKRIKRIKDDTKGRTFQSKNFPSKESWREVLRKPQKKR
jgi:hypothetical protein